MTTATNYNEQAYGPAYRSDVWAISPNGLNTAAEFVEGIYIWAREEDQKSGATYREHIRGTAAALERAAAAADTGTGNAYKAAAHRLRELARDTGRTSLKGVTVNNTYNLFKVLRSQALNEHRRHTERAEEYAREQMEQEDREHDADHRPAA